MGFPGHVWTHGIDSKTREADIRAIYAGTPEAEALLARYGIDYVVVGSLEHGVMPVNHAFFERFTKIGDSDEYQFYKIAK